jgi:uncharacterized protein YecT (DUF1311 family)
MFHALLLLLLHLTTYSVPPAANNPPPPKSDTAKPAQPCAEAKSPVAASDCFAKLYVDADAQLNVTYNQIVTAMKSLLTDAQRGNNPTQIAHHQAALDRFLAAQRAWLNYRDLHCDSVKFQYEGGTLSPAAWSQCMAETTQQRIATLTSDYALTN